MDDKALMGIATELLKRAKNQVVIRGLIWFDDLGWPTFRRRSAATIDLYTLCTNGRKQGFYNVHYCQEDGKWVQGKEPELILLGNGAREAREALFKRLVSSRDALWGIPLWLATDQGVWTATDQVVICLGTKINGRELSLRRVSPWDFRLMLHYTRLHTYLSVIQQREGDEEAWYLKDILYRFDGFYGDHITRWRKFLDS